jgi:hypothetical protein
MDKKIYLALAVIAIVALLFLWFRIKKQKKEKMSIEKVYNFDVVDEAMGGSGILSDPINQSRMMYE